MSRELEVEAQILVGEARAYVRRVREFVEGEGLKARTRCQSCGEEAEHEICDGCLVEVMLYA
ncbi:MAG: hypothetical protein ACE5Z5_12875 [Candidatus Bathyarchaeia archaeon]